MAKAYQDIAFGDLLTPSIADDANVSAGAQSVDGPFKSVQADIGQVLILSRIDSLSEPILDRLAYRFHVEGWDKADSVERKRELIRSAVELHRYKGTPWAVKTALEALGWPAELAEWFEYSGDPYRFKVAIDASAKPPTATTWDDIESVINDWKNERSHLDEIAITVSRTSEVPVIASACVGHEHVIIEPGA